MTEPIRLAVAGASGRMGVAVADAARADPRVALTGGFGRADREARAAVLARAQVIVDVSTPSACAALAQELARTGGPALVAGATGFSPRRRRRWPPRPGGSRCSGPATSRWA